MSRFLKQVWQAAVAHRGKVTFVGMVVFNSAVHALPMPMPHGSSFYSWLYAFAHGLAGGLFHPAGGGDPW